MTELVKLLVDLLVNLWPLRIVWAWQHGVYFFCGRAVGVVGPGVKLIFPFLCDVRTVSVVPEIYLTPLQTVQLRDKTMLTYSASITVVVRDALAAYTTLGHWAETVVEIAASMLSEGLADAEPERFGPARGKRDRLIDEFRKTINEDLKVHGLEVTALRLNNFVPGVKTWRLLLDRAVLGNQQHPAGSST